METSEEKDMISLTKCNFMTEELLFENLFTLVYKLTFNKSLSL